MPKKGTTKGLGPSMEMSPSFQVQKKEIHKYYISKWNTTWSNYKEARQTKIFFPEVNVKMSLALLKKKRKELGILIQFFSGHNNLKYHKNLQEGTDNPESCRLCWEGEESSFHVIGECPAMQSIRWSIFHKLTLSTKPSWKLKQIERFLRESPIGKMLTERD